MFISQMSNVYLPYENVGAGGATYPLWKAAIKVSSSCSNISDLVISQAKAEFVQS